MVKIIRSYPELAAEIRKDLGPVRANRMSKQARLDYAASKGWVYDPPANFGTNVPVTHYAITGPQPVREEGKIIATVEPAKTTYMQKVAEEQAQRQKESNIKLAQEHIKQDWQTKTGVTYTEYPQQLRFQTTVKPDTAILTPPGLYRTVSSYNMPSAIARPIPIVATKQNVSKLITQEVGIGAQSRPNFASTSAYNVPPSLTEKYINWYEFKVKPKAERLRAVWVETPASYMTGGMGAPIEQRSYWGRQAQQFTSAAMYINPIPTGAFIAEVPIKGVGLGMGLADPNYRSAALKEFFVTAPKGAAMVYKQPSTYAVALAGGALKVKTQQRPVLQKSAMATKRIILSDRQITDISRYNAVIKMGRKTFKVSGKGLETWFPTEEGYTSKITQQFNIAKGIKLYPGTSQGLSSSLLAGDKTTLKLIESQTYIKYESNNLFMRAWDVTNVQKAGSGAMKGQSYSFILAQKKLLPGRVYFDNTPISAGRLSLVQPFTSGRSMQIIQPQQITEYWGTASIGSTPSLPRGVSIQPMTTGLKIYREPGMLTSKTAGLARNKILLQDLTGQKGSNLPAINKNYMDQISIASIGSMTPKAPALLPITPETLNISPSGLRPRTSSFILPTFQQADINIMLKSNVSLFPETRQILRLIPASENRYESLTRSIQESIIRPIEMSGLRPMQETISKSMQESIMRPMQTTIQRPMQRTMQRPIQTYLSLGFFAPVPRSALNQGLALPEFAVPNFKGSMSITSQTRNVVNNFLGYTPSLRAISTGLKAPSGFDPFKWQPTGLEPRPVIKRRRKK